MLFSGKSIGVQATPSGIAFALLRGRRSAPYLEKVAFRPLASGTMRTSLREPNILEPKHFSSRLMEAYNLLFERDKRISISLPDTTGRIMLMDMEGRFNSKSEAFDMIRWKLKKSLPFEMTDVHLDYQLLNIRENGDMSLMVALVSKTVIKQYENLFLEAGFTPSNINLNTLNLCHAIGQKIELMGNCMLLSLYNNSMSIMAVLEDIPAFLRIKELPDIKMPDNRLYREIKNSLLVYQERFPAQPPLKIACMASPSIDTEFSKIVADATGQEPLLLDLTTGINKSSQAPSGREALYPFHAAIGAALGNM